MPIASPHPPARPAPVAAPLFTHHQIVELAAPFARCGLVLDLAASDRLRRSLVFRADTPDPAQPLQQSLQLESPRAGHFRLTRTLRADAGLQATLQAEGTRPDELLAQVQAVPPQRQFHTGPGYRMASSGCARAMDGSDRSFQMTHAVVQTDALTLTVYAPAPGVRSAALDIQPRHPGPALPPDLLAVLGWDWSMLQAGLLGWQGSVRLRGTAHPDRDGAEHAVRRAATHLVRTLAEPPLRFHERLRAARLGVLARQAIPVLACGLLAVLALFADTLRATRDSPLTLGLLCLPLALLLLFLLRSERPRLALPAWPRPLAAQAWEVAR